jgi:hypothetical protein
MGMTEKSRSELLKEVKADQKIVRSSINVAIEKAQMFGTPLIGKRGNSIMEFSPDQMRRKLSAKK